MRETAIVVGAGGALGQAIVADLVAAGVDILGVARNPASLATLAERHGDRFRPVIADMADDSAIEAVGAANTAPVAMVVHAPGVPVAGGARVAPPAALVYACNLTVGGCVRLETVRSSLRGRGCMSV